MTSDLNNLLEVQSRLDSLAELVLTLLLLLLQKHGVATLLVVDATLCLGTALPAASSLVLALLDGLSRVPVTNRTVALGHQSIDRNVVLLDVIVDLLERPVCQRVDLDHTCIIKFDDVEISTLASLAAATTSNNSSDSQF